MTTYYVRKTGNDTTGDGSTGAPWLTVHKAHSTVAIGGGDVIKVGAGTYAENSGSGSFACARAFVTETIIESESGLTDVVIVGASSATRNTLISNSTHLTFKHIRFETRIGGQTNGAVSMIGTGDYIAFEDCEYYFLSDAVLHCAGLTMYVTAGLSVGHVTFTRCKAFTDATVTDRGYGFVVRPAVGATASYITFTDCETFQDGILAKEGIWIDGGDHCTIDGGTFSSAGHSIYAGVDAFTSDRATTDLVISDVTCVPPGIYGLAVMAGVTGATVSNCSVLTDTMYGIIIKHAVNVTLSGCTSISADGYSALYYKAVTNVHSTNMTLVANVDPLSDAQAVFKLTGDENDTKSSNWSLTHSRLTAQGATAVFNIAGAADDEGDGVVDYNVYSTSAGFGRLGDVLTIADLAAMRAAWDAYNDGTNDDHSRMAGQSVVNLGGGRGFGINSLGGRGLRVIG